MIATAQGVTWHPPRDLTPYGRVARRGVFAAGGDAELPHPGTQRVGMQAQCGRRAVATGDLPAGSVERRKHVVSLVRVQGLRCVRRYARNKAAALCVYGGRGSFRAHARGERMCVARQWLDRWHLDQRAGRRDRSAL
jgi:hypothetical protein